MSEAAFVFHDLACPERPPTPEEDAWLAAIATETDANELTLTLAPSNAARDPSPVLTRDVDGSWRAGRYVGEIRRDGRTLEIRPRLGIDVIATWAGAALNLRILPRAAEQRSTSVLIAELVAATWRAALIDASRHGLPGIREEQHHVGAFVEGRLDVPRTVKLRAARKPLVASWPRPKQLDNPVLRSIAIADRVLNARLDRPDWRGKRVDELIPRVWAAVGPRPRLPTRRELERVRYNPITLPYRRVAELSWQIAKRRGIFAAATAERTDGLLIDVAELWELFLVHCARRAFGNGAVTHSARTLEPRMLLRSRTDPERRMGRLYPDIVVSANGSARLILDAKYKPLTDPRGVDREDLYQLAAYLTVYSATPLPIGMLGYPTLNRDVASAERYGPWATPQSHSAYFTRLPISEEGCVARLSSFGA